jgi:16S rRNA (cytidine1402-2'-O)-methyltransferase
VQLLLFLLWWFRVCRITIFISQDFSSKKGRQTKLKQLAEEKKTIVLYESPHKINTTLEQIKEFFGENTKVSLSREISKKFEETKRGTIDELIAFSKSKTLKGEIVLIVNNAI